jgi:hypothetical protein
VPVAAAEVKAPTAALALARPVVATALPTSFCSGPGPEQPEGTCTFYGPGTLTTILDATGKYAGYSDDTCIDGPYQTDPSLTLPVGATVSVAGGGASGTSGCSSGNNPMTGTATITIGPQFKISGSGSTFNVHGIFRQSWTYFDPNPPGEPLTSSSEQLTTFEIPVQVMPLPYVSPTPPACTPTAIPSSGIVVVHPRPLLRALPLATPGPCSSQPAPSATPYLAIVEEAVPRGQPTFIISSPYPGPSPIAVGQQLRLGVREVHGYPLTNITWSVPQPIVYGFNEAAVANPIEPFPANAWHEPNVYFYWTNSSNTSPKKTVWVSATVKGMRLTSDATYDVYTLRNVSISSALGTVTSDNADYTCAVGAEGTAGAFWLHIGDPCGNGTRGIVWKYSAGSPSVIPVGGILEMFQLIDASSSAQPAGNGPPKRKTVVLPLGVDETVPYNGSVPILQGAAAMLSRWDAPALQIDSSRCSQLQTSQTFIDYFMYRPDATQSRTSIPVDIGLLTWNWAGATTYTSTQSGGLWHLTFASKSVSTVSTQYPVMPSWLTVNKNGGENAC